MFNHRLYLIINLCLNSCQFAIFLRVCGHTGVVVSQCLEPLLVDGEESARHDGVGVRGPHVGLACTLLRGNLSDGGRKFIFSFFFFEKHKISQFFLKKKNLITSCHSNFMFQFMSPLMSLWMKVYQKVVSFTASITGETII